MHISTILGRITKGRWGVDGRYITAGRGGTIAETFATGDGRCLADAMYIAHCCNNFEAALQAIRDLVDIIQYETSFSGPAYLACRDALERLEQVVGPGDRGDPS